MSQDFLLEIGTEEIPAGFLTRAFQNLPRQLAELLSYHRLPHEGIKVMGTPRRLAVRRPSALPEGRKLPWKILKSLPRKKASIWASGRKKLDASALTSLPKSFPASSRTFLFKNPCAGRTSTCVSPGRSTGCWPFRPADPLAAGPFGPKCHSVHFGRIDLGKLFLRPPIHGP